MAKDKRRIGKSEEDSDGWGFVWELIGIAGLQPSELDISLRELWHICAGAYRKTADIMWMLHTVNCARRAERLDPSAFNPFIENKRRSHRAGISIDLVRKGKKTNLSALSVLSQ